MLELTAHVERDLDQAARRFVDELLRTGDARSRATKRTGDVPVDSRYAKWKGLS